MKRARLLFGRQSGCDVRIPSAAVSREHCEVVLDGAGLKLRDLGSSNGTYVDQHRVREADLTAGSIIAVGPAVFVVCIDGKPASFDPKKALSQGAKPAATTVKSAGKGGLDDDANEGTSVSDLDFDFLDDDDEDTKKKL